MLNLGLRNRRFWVSNEIHCLHFVVHVVAKTWATRFKNSLNGYIEVEELYRERESWALSY
jgi:hypothetical protein